MSELSSDGAVGGPARLDTPQPLAVRLDALKPLALLDLPAQAGFDRLTRLVRHMLRVPVAGLTLADRSHPLLVDAAAVDGLWPEQLDSKFSGVLCRLVIESGCKLRITDVAKAQISNAPAVAALGAAAYLGMPMRNGDGVVVGALCAIDRTVREWTEQEEIVLADLAIIAASELALRSLAEQLEARVQREVAARTSAQGEVLRKRRLEVLGQLAGGVAHDFANVLQTVQAGVRLAKSNLTRDPAKALAMLDRVAEASQRGGSITRRLLGFARRGEARVEQVDTAELLHSLQGILAHTLNQPGLAVRIDAHTGLPPVMADRGELETVLVNLATNARDAMPRGGTLTFSARLDTRDATRFVLLSAHDTGCGMTAELLARASEPFFTTKPEGEGTGLGLSMARDFALQAGGHFDIESQPGAGTLVAMWLPGINPA